MNQACTQEQHNAKIKKGWDLNSMEQSEKPNTHGNTDMSISCLGGVYNIRAAFYRVIYCQQGIRQDHEKST